MIITRILAFALCVMLATAAASAADLSATDAHVWQAQDLQRRIDSLSRQQRNLAQQLQQLDERLTRSSAESERSPVEKQRMELLDRQRSLESDRGILIASLAALPESVKADPQSATGPIGPFDPRGLSPLDISGVSGQVSNPRAFNPSISVIPDFTFFRDDQKGGSFELVEKADGFHGAHAEEGHEHGSLDEGFNLREMELAFIASVDPYFDAVALLAVSEEGIEAEEVYVQTRSLPGGLQLKAGKFLSGIGYINRQHPHQWDFVDQNLAYELLLGGEGLNEKGVQATWLPPTPFYLQFGAEMLQGTNEKFSNYVGPEEYPGITEESEPRIPAHKPGPRLFTGFAKVAPNLGYSHALQFGGSYGYSKAHQEIHDHDGDGVPEGVLDGTGSFMGGDLVYKYDSPREYGAGDLTIQAEYFYRKRDMDNLGRDMRVVFKNDGWYAQAVYGIAPRWDIAARISQAGLINERKRGTALDNYKTSSQYSVAATFSPTEFSRIRAQYNHGKTWVGGVEQKFHQVFVQLQVSLGAHGAHRF
jgi:hypothetical protein